jgi:hydrogenase maturation factor HypE
MTDMRDMREDVQSISDHTNMKIRTDLEREEDIRETVIVINDHHIASLVNNFSLQLPYL